jgi:hypothetical protein
LIPFVPTPHFLTRSLPLPNGKTYPRPNLVTSLGIELTVGAIELFNSSIQSTPTPTPTSVSHSRRVPLAPRASVLNTTLQRDLDAEVDDCLDPALSTSSSSASPFSTIGRRSSASPAMTPGKSLRDIFSFDNQKQTYSGFRVSPLCFHSDL